MNWKHALAVGAGTGILVGLLMQVITHIPLGTTSDGGKITVMYHWAGALLTVIGIPLLSAFSVKYGSIRLNFAEPRQRFILPVAFLTCLPVLFSSAGGNGSLAYAIGVVFMGGGFGLFWSAPSALLASLKTSEEILESE